MKLKQVKRILAEDSTINTPRSQHSTNSTQYTPYQRSLSSENIKTPSNIESNIPACDTSVKKKVYIVMLLILFKN